MWGGGRGPGPPTFRVIKESSLEGSFATVRANYNRDMLRMQEMAFYSIIFPNFLGSSLDFQNARAFRSAHKIPPSSIGITPPALGRQGKFVGGGEGYVFAADSDRGGGKVLLTSNKAFT